MWSEIKQTYKRLFGISNSNFIYGIYIKHQVKLNEKQSNQLRVTSRVIPLQKDLYSDSNLKKKNHAKEATR